MDSPFSQNEEGTLLDVLEDTTEEKPYEHLMTESLHMEIDTIVSKLEKRQQEVISCFFGLGGKKKLSLEEVGKKLGLTRERARQIREQALLRLREEAIDSELKSYLAAF